MDVKLQELEEAQELVVIQARMVVQVVAHLILVLMLLQLEEEEGLYDQKVVPEPNSQPELPQLLALQPYSPLSSLLSALSLALLTF